MSTPYTPTANDSPLTRLHDRAGYLAREFGVKKIGLFGSFARGTASADSDVDLVIEFERPIGLRFVVLTEYLETLLQRKVDVLTPSGIRNIRNHDISDSIDRDLTYVP